MSFQPSRFDPADRSTGRRETEGSLNPNLEGIVTKSSISLVGDTLRLSGELNPVTGERIDAVYRRAK